MLLRTEGAALAGVATALYAKFGLSWWLFAALLLTPDIGMLGYIRGNRIGAAMYDLFHTYLPPAILAVAGVLAELQLAYSIALIWFAHIGMDRLLGYGLKYQDGFRHTHLGRIGKS